MCLLFSGTLSTLGLPLNESYTYLYQVTLFLKCIGTGRMLHVAQGRNTEYVMTKTALTPTPLLTPTSTSSKVLKRTPEKGREKGRTPNATGAHSSPPHHSLPYSLSLQQGTRSSRREEPTENHAVVSIRVAHGGDGK